MLVDLPHIHSSFTALLILDMLYMFVAKAVSPLYCARLHDVIMRNNNL